MVFVFCFLKVKKWFLPGCTASYFFPWSGHSWLIICIIAFTWYILCIPRIEANVFFYIIFSRRSVRISKYNLSTSGLIIDLILFEHTIGDHTEMSKLLESYSVDSLSSKVDKSSLGMIIGSWTYALSLSDVAQLQLCDMPSFFDCVMDKFYGKKPWICLIGIFR